MPTDRLHPRRTDVPDMSADLIAGRRFGQSWRGYDTDEVQQFLAQVAMQVRGLRDRCEHAEAARREAEQRAAHPQIDEATLMAAVGDETAGILRTARSAAAEITAKAEANAKAIEAAASARSAELVAQAESLLVTRTAEADSVASEIREHALAEADHVRELAQQQANALAEEAAKKCEDAVQAAQAVREKILTDLARRRKLGTVQVEQLRAGRERLLDAYLVVRRTLEEVTDELQRADAEARAASDATGRQHGVNADELLDLRGEDTWGPLGAELKAATTRPPAADEGAATAGAVVPKVTPPAKAAGAIGTSDRHALTVDKQDKPAMAGQQGGSGAGDTAIVARTDAIESVRILRQEAPSAPAAEAAGHAQGPGATETAGATETPGAAGAAEAGGPDEAPGHAPAPGAAEARGDSQGSQASQPDVQSLFARIRASRAEATSTARKALYEGDVEAEAAEVAPEPRAGEAVADAGIAGDGPTGGQDNHVQDFLDRRDELTSRLESSLARKLKRALQDEQNALLDRLRSLKGPVTEADVLPNVEEQPDRFVDAGRPVLEEAVQAGSELVASFYGEAAGAQPGAEGIDDLAEELGKTITEPLRQRLELAFRSSNDEPADVADALGPAYREWKTHRIEAAARDQVAAAFARGAYLAFPPRSLLRWVASPLEGPCPDCEDNALAGEQPKGEHWPTGQLYPPAHPGCRCSLAPPEAHPDEPVPAAAGASNGTSAT